MIGWIALSRQAVASAERALLTDQKGVRDEIGFLALHQVFADHLFPGTSVLHTRLRYALFVPWLVMRSGGSEQQLRADQLALTRQLCDWKEDQSGIIGGTLMGEPSQTAAMIYWSALGRWGLQRPHPGMPLLARSQVLLRVKALAAQSRALAIDGEAIASEELLPFVGMPSPPGEFLRKGTPISFQLTPRERTFLRDRLMGVSISGDASSPASRPSLLAQIAERKTDARGVPSPWSNRIFQAADQEIREVLLLASHASALGGIGRAAYSALVERAKNFDESTNENRFARSLAVMRDTHGAAAKSLDIKALRLFAPDLPKSLVDVLEQTKKWLACGRKAPDTLEDVYRYAEEERKGDRARLGSTRAASKRRSEWNTAKMPYPYPSVLHYRWGNVQGLMEDLLF